MGKLVECKTCKHQVDQSAKACPNCGVGNPGSSAGKGCLLFIGLVAVIYAGIKVSDYFPNSEANETHSFQVESVSETTLNNKPAVSIYFSENESGHCEATLNKEFINPGFSVSSDQRSDTRVEVSCNLASYYVQSSKHPTSVTFDIVSIDQAKKEALIKTSFNLVDPYKPDYVRFDNVELTISGSYFDQFYKDHE